MMECHIYDVIKIQMKAGLQSRWNPFDESFPKHRKRFLNCVQFALCEHKNQHQKHFHVFLNICFVGKSFECSREFNWNFRDYPRIVFASSYAISVRMLRNLILKSWIWILLVNCGRILIRHGKRRHEINWTPFVNIISWFCCSNYDENGMRSWWHCGFSTEHTINLNHSSVTHTCMTFLSFSPTLKWLWYILKVFASSLTPFTRIFPECGLEPHKRQMLTENTYKSNNLLRI